jgi:type I restriction enzyme, S subunit
VKLEPYPQYSPSTVPENPLRPSHWEVKPLKYLIAPGVGYKAGPFGSALITSKLNESGEVAVLSPEDVANGLDPADFARFLPESRVIEMKAFEVLPQDVVFPIGGTLGRAAIMPTGSRGILHQRLARIRTDPNILVPEFVKLLLSDYSGFKALDELERRGAILHHLTREQFLNRRIAIPTVPEQLAILMFVKTETSKVDALIGKQEQLIATLREDRIATITHAVTKGLDPGVEVCETGSDWLAEVPSTWSTTKLKWSASLITSGSRGWAQYYAEDGDYFVRIGNLCRGSLGFDDSDVHYVQVPPGAEGSRTITRVNDLLFSITAYLGSVAVVDHSHAGAFVSQHVSLVRLMGGQLDPMYAGYFSLSEVGQRQLNENAYGGTKIQLSLGDIGNLELPLPPLSEQGNIVRFLDARCAEIDVLIAKAAEVIETLREYRSALITDAVTGKIDVRGAA